MLLCKVTVLNLYVTIIRPDFIRLWLNDNAMFYEILFRRNYKETSAHLPDKHFECCIFNIVQHHQTFVNKD